jgi:hypothetical protein
MPQDRRTPLNGAKRHQNGIEAKERQTMGIHICSVCGGKCEAGLTDVCWGCRVNPLITPQVQEFEDYGREPGGDHVVARRRIKLGVGYLDHQQKKMCDFAKIFLSQSDIKTWNEQERQQGLEDDLECRDFSVLYYRGGE